MAKAPGRRLRGLRAAREARNLTQRALAERSGVTYSTIGNLETGRRAASRDTVEKLAAALGVAPAVLYTTPR